MMSWKAFCYRLLETQPEGRSFRADRWTRHPQPRQPKAQVLLTVLTPGGVNANGKVSGYQYFSQFTQILRSKGYRTHFCFSLREVRRRMRKKIPTILVHIFGEDHYQIMSDELDACETGAVATFNAARTGRIISDKLLFHNEISTFEIKVPELHKEGRKGFVRARLGTAEDTWIIDDKTPSNISISTDHLVTQFIDTRVSYQNREYFTTVRLLCVNDKIVHAFPRCRDAAEGDASVHANDTPLDSGLIEYFNTELIERNIQRFSNIAENLHASLGHGFYAHDLLIERTTNDIFVCETNFKFDAFGYWDRFRDIKNEIPSQSIFYPSTCFIKKSSLAFSICCDNILEWRPEK